MSNRKVYCVIVSYNDIKWIENCLRTLRQSSLPVHVIIIDNGSTDGTQEVIKQHPEVEFVQAPQNLGFGKGNNIGIKRGYDNGAGYIFLLNQDAWIEENTLGDLVDMAEKYPEYGILSPMHLNGSGTALDYNFSNYIAPAKCKSLYSDIYLGKIKDAPYDLSFVNAAAWLMTRNCIENVGGFSSSFFHYSEDDNYCQRVLFHGLRIGVAANTRIFHDRENSAKSDYFIDYVKNIKRGMALKYSNPFLNWSVFRMIADSIKELLRNIFVFIFQLRPARFKEISSRVKVIFTTSYKKLKQNNERSRKKGMSFLEGLEEI